MLKIEPSRQDIRGRLDQAQEQLKKKQQAQVVWQSILAKDQEKVLETKERELSAKEIAAWASQEQAVRERLAKELESAEADARQELDVIERAVSEIRAKSGNVPASLGSPDANRLQALEREKLGLEEKLLQEREIVVERERQLQDQVRRESELLKHAIEMERLEAEAKQKDAALSELEARLRLEREDQNRRLEEERRRSQQAEENLRKQLQELMREEMAKLRDEMQLKAKAEIEDKLDQTQKRLQSVEEETRKGEQLASEKLREEQLKADEFRRSVEEKVRKEREAIQGLRVSEEVRKQAIVEEALKRRSVRTGTSGGEEKQKIIQASRRISDALHAASTKHLESDVEGMLETAQRYMQQDLLLDAMRICQKITALDPQNEKVKALLKEIYVRKGL
jgi:colicin import membrane protein